MKIIYEHIPFKKEYTDQYPENKNEGFVCDLNDSLLDHIKESKIIHKTGEEISNLLNDEHAIELFPDGADFVYNELQGKFILNINLTTEEKEKLSLVLQNKLVRSRVSIKSSVDNRDILDIPEDETCTIYWAKILSILK